MSIKNIAGEGDAELTVPDERQVARPLLGRKSVLLGMLTSGFVIANAGNPSAANAGTIKPRPIAATLPAYAANWTPTTAYAAGQQVISPRNDVVSANVAHTSSAAFANDKMKWTFSATYAPTPKPGKNPLTGWFHADGYGLSIANTDVQNDSAFSSVLSDMSPGDVLYVPPANGAYRFTNLDLSKAITIRGGGARVANQRPYGDASWTDQANTTITAGSVLRSTSTNGIAINVGNTSAMSGTALIDFVLIGPGSGMSTGIAVGGSGIGYPVRTRLTNVQVANFSEGILASCENAIWTGLFITACGTGLHAVYPFNGNTVSGINVERCVTYAIRLVDSDANVFNGGVIQGNYAANVISLETSTAECRNNRFTGIYFENFGPGSTNYNDLSLGVVGAGLCAGNSFIECHWGNYENNSYQGIVFGAHAARNTLVSGHLTPPITLSTGSVDNQLTIAPGSGPVTDVGENLSWHSYTPVWDASSISPKLGNGTLTGRYMQRGRVVHYRIAFTYGSTSATGEGQYTFTMPVMSAGMTGYEQLGNGILTNTEVRPCLAVYGGWGKICVLRIAAEAFVDNRGAGVAWAAGHTLTLGGTYEAARLSTG